MILLVATDQIMASMRLSKSFTNDLFKNQNFPIFLPHLKNKNQVSTKECSSQIFFGVLLLPKFAIKKISGYDEKMVKTCDTCQQLSLLMF
jgi:hypothetical protein